ncbi:DUF3798 domain-containing protein [Oceanotoga sp. DSM 15011]|uniref:Uncharacterized protein DUF3798 n=2 Tax=Petrotogaceae TaxID=1643949 RepID=A0AA45C7Y8_9BACT|nr:MULTISPECIES: DUF3798 domain-containing protein [Oceanotoga]MDN5341327.1 hypothetical protein [Oceanotoga sp.]MDO7976947.1 DUF3798 domain-containing protein [Oceanotoga teriensis]PWJ95751.1 uncharacterized protein DUF3798 [Oceanotoga teriensis]UYO99584.1 DUF3798 domain-containing protein [Oceanotoga sp. DSM 15011]
MKKILSLILLLSFMVFSFSANFHIGVVTGTVSQSEDDLRGAEQLIKEYGDVANGGMIQHVTYPDNFMQEMETTIAQIVGLSDDPLMKAIVVNQAVPGTVEAFRRIKEKRPDIILLAGNPHEDPGMIADAADLSVTPDNVARGYLIVKAAKMLGAEKFMHISFPRHMSYELLSRRRDIMREAAKDLGMEFIDMGSPDPTSDIGIAGAQQFILEKVPAWLDAYGNKTAFFCTNDAHTEPLLKKVSELGGFFVEADLPSPTMGYPGALGIVFTDNEKGNWPAILKKVEKEVVDRGGKNRMGTWAYSFGFTTTAALGEHAINVINKKEELLDFDAVMKSFMKYTPGAGWNGSYYVDADGVDRENFILVYQDTYVFGKGYLGMTSLEVPDKYFGIE